jgi:hypothetical protein
MLAPCDKRRVDESFFALLLTFGTTLKAHKSQFTGKPISQRDNDGLSCPLNWPGFSVAAGEPVGGAPEAVSEACLGNWSSLVRSEPSGFVPVVAIPGVSL